MNLQARVDADLSAAIFPQAFNVLINEYAFNHPLCTSFVWCFGSNCSHRQNRLCKWYLFNFGFLPKKKEKKKKVNDREKFQNPNLVPTIN
jgi:hypothetical protein